MPHTMESVSQASSPSFAFSHPAQPDWLDEDVPEVAIESIDGRFRGTNVHPGDVLGPLASVTRYVTDRRLDLEVKHAAKTFATQDAYTRYKELAGDDTRVLEFVEHFARCAVQSLIDDPLPTSDRSINLGGNRQYGLMNATDITDGMSNRLTEEIVAKYGRERAKPYVRNAHDLLRYRFEYYDPKDRPITEEPQFAIITRRRPVLDLYNIRIFKEAVGLLVLRNLPRETVNSIYRDTASYYDTLETIKHMEGKQIMATHDIFEPFGEQDLAHLNSLRKSIKKAFPTAGGVFERAIESHDDSATDVLPISADYIMRVKKEDV